MRLFRFLNVPAERMCRFLLLFVLLSGSLTAQELLELNARHRLESTPGSNEWLVQEKQLSWEADKTAIVICDMWDKHWCPGATARVAEMAPRMNEAVKAARERGVFIIHCPSDTLDFYENHPGRLLARSAPEVEPIVPLQNWCSLDHTKEAPLPIDDSDEGCACGDCSPHKAWSRQIATIDIEPGDAITDSAEAYYLMRERGITNVIVMGVHANMCVLGRPFSIRQMVNQGQNVVLMRDLTDAMYNPAMPPFVSHFRGTELVVEHIEKYWCPSITSVAFLGGDPFQFQGSAPAKVVFLIGEDEYQTWETLPEFVEQDLDWRGFDISVIQQSPENKHRFPGLSEVIDEADLLFVSVRRRALPADDLNAIRAHLEAGKPLIGIRTTSHAFAPRGDSAELGASWPEFDPQVLGGNYHGHHGNGPLTTVTFANGVNDHPILKGVAPEGLTGYGSLYEASPLKETAVPLLIGEIPGKPSEPVAWTHRYGPNNARIFYTSLGHEGDFQQPSFRRLLLNAIHWALKK